MRLPEKVWAKLNDFTMHQQTGQLILHFHQGVLIKYELVQVEKVSRWGDCALDHGLLVVEDGG